MKASLKDGYLTITAAKRTGSGRAGGEDGNLYPPRAFCRILPEKFYVGEDITEADIKAEFKHGILKLFVPKRENSRK